MQLIKIPGVRMMLDYGKLMISIGILAAVDRHRVIRIRISNAPCQRKSRYGSSQLTGTIIE
jgi:hypothetical protein